MLRAIVRKIEKAKAAVSNGYLKLGLACALVLSAASAHAADGDVPAEITTAFTSVDTLVGKWKTVTLGIALFSLGLWVLYKARSRR